MTAERASPERDDDRPTWDDEYVERVAGRLSHHYDLERGYRLEGEQFTMYGQLRVTYERHAIHPSVTFGHHEAREHLFVTECERPTVATLEGLEALGERLAEEWVEADEDHYSTDFTFAVIAAELPEDAREYVSGYRNRTLLTYGYNGHYEINLLVVVPAREVCVSSANADVAQAFAVWEPIVAETPGRLDRLLGWLSR
ncbi:hypothetical protein [Natronobiforma cellulositropha]|uniref:hypothetical protein n=1 Tax=Natronobiforma cellulositropha TaxID=1679076 RepID=UPI0021D58C93|nr:hypothetical protein [Natronobiforma cellulositropha]